MKVSSHDPIIQQKITLNISTTVATDENEIRNAIEGLSVTIESVNIETIS